MYLIKIHTVIEDRASPVFAAISRDLGAIEAWLVRDRKVRAVAAHVDRNAGRARRERDRQSPERVESLYEIGGQG